jgi:hypothetical protein
MCNKNVLIISGNFFKKSTLQTYSFTHCLFLWKCMTNNNNGAGNSFVLAGHFHITNIIIWQYNCDISRRRLTNTKTNVFYSSTAVLKLTFSYTPQTVGLPWTSDRPLTEAFTWKCTTLTRDRHSYSWRDSNPQSQQAVGRTASPYTFLCLDCPCAWLFPYLYFVSTSFVLVSLSSLSCILPFVFCLCLQHRTQTSFPGGIRTRNPSKRSAADLRFRPLGLWDRQLKIDILNHFKKTLHKHL